MIDNNHDSLLQILVNSVANVFSPHSPLNVFIPPPDTETPTKEQFTSGNIPNTPQYQDSPPNQAYAEK